MLGTDCALGLMGKKGPSGQARVLRATEVGQPWPMARQQVCASPARAWRAPWTRSCTNVGLPECVNTEIAWEWGAGAYAGGRGSEQRAGRAAAAWRRKSGPVDLASGVWEWAPRRRTSLGPRSPASCHPCAHHSPGFPPPSFTQSWEPHVTDKVRGPSSVVDAEPSSVAMATLWLIGTLVAMETCLKPKSILGEGFWQRKDGGDHLWPVASCPGFCVSCSGP